MKKLLTVVFTSLSCLFPAWAQDMSLVRLSPIAEDVARYADIWLRVRSSFAIPALPSTLVAPHIAAYTKNPEYIARVMARAQPYLFHVVKTLEARNMPTELALLPFVESAFNPQARSHAKAVGMWQFIPSTGRDFNLKQNTFKDERRDVLASTEAALSYLQKLHSMFGDWHLALAAYNWGEGRVQRAIDRQHAAGLPTDFVSLTARMPKETRHYVPRLQAIKTIITTPARYQVKLPAVENKPYFVAIDKKQNIDVKLAAHLAEMSLQEFKALNPQYNRPVIVADDETKLLLPKNKVAAFQENLSQWPESLSRWTTYVVRNPRERVETIAEKFDAAPHLLRQVNNIPPKMVLKAGSTVLVPKTRQKNTEITPTDAERAVLAVAPEFVRKPVSKKTASRKLLAQNSKKLPQKSLKTKNKVLAKRSVKTSGKRVALSQNGRSSVNMVR